MRSAKGTPKIVCEADTCTEAANAACDSGENVAGCEGAAVGWRDGWLLGRVDGLDDG